MSQDFTEVAGVYETFSTKGAAASYRDEVEGFTAFEVIGPVDGQSVIDLACGFGRYGLALGRRGAARVVGVDISPAVDMHDRRRRAVGAVGDRARADHVAVQRLVRGPVLTVAFREPCRTQWPPRLPALEPVQAVPGMLVAGAGHDGAVAQRPGPDFGAAGDHRAELPGYEPLRDVRGAHVLRTQVMRREGFVDLAG